MTTTAAPRFAGIRQELAKVSARARNERSSLSAAALRQQSATSLKEEASALIAIPAPSLGVASLKRVIAAELLEGHPKLLAAANAHITADISRLTG